MAVYTCGKCLFCFERKGEVEACPDCAHLFVREANEDEIAEYLQNHEMAELEFAERK